MKKTMIFIMLIAMTSLNVSAQDNEAFMEDALLLTKLAQSSVESSLNQLYTMIPEDKLEDFKSEMKPIMDEFYMNAAKISMKHYTHDEVKDILKFYDSDLGKMMLDKQDDIMAETMTLSQGLSMKLMPLVTKYTQ